MFASLYFTLLHFTTLSRLLLIVVNEALAPDGKFRIGFIQEQAHTYKILIQYIVADMCV
jgi:hypothetical protein